MGDAIGRRSLLFMGIVTAILGTLLVPTSPDYWVITLGTFLVGLGWSCINVAATAVVADTTHAYKRGRAIGTMDAFSSASSIILPLLAGPLVEAFGLNSVGVVGVLVMLVPLPMLVRLRELAPGKYGHANILPDRA